MTKRIGFSLLGFALALLANLAHAEDVAAKINFEWKPPTTNTDGSTLTDLAKQEIYVSTAPITDSNKGTGVTLSASATSYQWSGTVANGSTIYGRLRACNTAGVCSVLSGEGSKALPVLRTPGAPGTPAATVVTVTLVVEIPAAAK